MTTQLWQRSAAEPAAEEDAGAQSPTSPMAGERPDGRAGGRGRRRRWALPAAIVVLVVVVALLFVTTGPSPTSTVPLDPRNPTANGAQALARVLETQGVRVDIARGQAELARARVDKDTTVLLARTIDLAPATTRELVLLTVDAERLVVVSPPRSVLRDLSSSTGVTEIRRAEKDLVAAGCQGGDVRDGETLSRSESEFTSPSTVASCFTHDAAAAVYVSLPRSATTAPLVLFGSTTALTNDQITQAANAAVALRMLGHSSRVVWYVPSRLDAPGENTGAAALIPSWIGPGLVLGGFAFAGLVLWRGRRFGRLVPEPLPVVVRAVETTESRGRLYRRARDASRAALVLQQATQKRLADYLGMPRSSAFTAAGGPDHALVAAVAAATGRPLEEVGTLLYGPPPSRDDHLLGLSVELADLEKEVRRS